VTLADAEGDARPQLVITAHPGEPPDGEPSTLDQVGIRHRSCNVPRVAQLTEALRATGYQTAGPPAACQDAAGLVHTVCCCDADGILVQFDEGGGGYTRPEAGERRGSEGTADPLPCSQTRAMTIIRTKTNAKT
jgi:hypothetical protein